MKCAGSGVYNMRPCSGGKYVVRFACRHSFFHSLTLFVLFFRHLRCFPWHKPCTAVSPLRRTDWQPVKPSTAAASGTTHQFTLPRDWHVSSLGSIGSLAPDGRWRRLEPAHDGSSGGDEPLFAGKNLHWVSRPTRSRQCGAGPWAKASTDPSPPRGSGPAELTRSILSNVSMPSMTWPKIVYLPAPQSQAACQLQATCC